MFQLSEVLLWKLTLGRSSCDLRLSYELSHAQNYCSNLFLAHYYIDIKLYEAVVAQGCKGMTVT